MEQSTYELAVSGIPWWQMARMTLAIFLGGIIGYERARAGRNVGLRTNMLIAGGSCLFTILSIEGFPLHGAAQDTGRIAAQIVTGVGFLGAGVLFQTRRRVRGITTAASIWMVAALGMAVGAGAIALAIYTAVLTIVILGLIPWLDAYFKPKNPSEE